MFPKIRCTVAQKNVLIDYMWDHRRLARNENDINTTETEWLRLAKTLNETGSVKSVEKWKITWRDLKRKALHQVRTALRNNKKPSEAALKITEILKEPGDGSPKQHRNSRMSSSPSLSAFLEESYQSQDLTETIDLDQSQEYLESSEGRESPSSLDLEAIECISGFSSDSSPSVSPTRRTLTRARSNQEQINTLVDCMAINSDMAFGNQTTPKKMADWRRLRQLLNRIGPARRTAAWQNTWRDLKRSALERNKISPNTNTPLKKKIVEIIKAYNEGRHRHNDTLADGDAQLRLPPQVKHLIQKPVQNVPPNHQDGHSENKVSAVNLPSLRQSPQRYIAKTKRIAARSNNTQILALVDYMDKHPAMAIAKPVARGTLCPYATEWRKLSYNLNRLGNVKRSNVAWKRTWRDIKKAAQKGPDSERNPYLYKRILEIMERGATAQNDTETNMEIEDVLPFSADFDQMSDQLFIGQRSDRSSPVQAENGDSQQNPKLKPVKITIIIDFAIKMPKIFHTDAKQIILNTLKYLRQKKDEGFSSNPLNNVVKLVVDITGTDIHSAAVINCRCTNAQKHALVDYMSTHLALATSRFVETLDRDPHVAEWRQLSKYLNKIGTAKSPISWKRTWRDLKFSVLKKKWANETLVGLDRRIIDICEKDVTDLQSETAQDFDTLPDPTTGMPVLYLQSPEHTSQLDIVLCDEDRSQGDPANQESQNSPNPKNTIEESPGRQSEMSLEPPSPEEMSPNQRSCEMSPSQRSREMSPGARSFRMESPAQRSEKDSPAHSENEKTPKSVSNTRRARCTSYQIKALVNHMARHPNLAKGRCLYNTDENDPIHDEWRRLSRYLNQLDKTVSAKSVTRWKSTWRSLVINASRRDRNRSQLNDMISRKILQILKKNRPETNGKSVKGQVKKPTENYVFLPSPSSTHRSHVSLPDPLKSEQDEDIKQNQQDRNTGTQRRNRTRSSTLQLRALADYMIANPDMAKNHKLDARDPAWVKITRHLNNIGPTRSVDAWIQTWRDLKLGVSSRARLKKTSTTLQGFREKRIMKLIGLPSPSHLPDSDCETVEEYNTLLQPEVVLAPRAPSPRSVLYNLAEILARKGPNDRPERRKDETPKAEPTSTVSSETNNILRALVQELKRGNELKSEQNGYLRELITELKTSTYTRTSQDTAITHIADSQTDVNATDIQKEDVDTHEVNENGSSNGDNEEMPAEHTPVIRPVALSSLTAVNTPTQQFKRVKVHSTLRSVEPKSLARKLVRLKDGTMVLVPSIIKPQVRPNPDKNDDQMYVVCKRR